MLTGVLLNWKRQKNVARILDAWRTSAVVNSAIVWNNNKATHLMHAWKHASIVNASRDMGLYTRFAAASLAQTEFVLIQDDDLLLPESTVARLLTAAQHEPNIIHGIFGRRPKADGTYAESLLGNMQVPIVLTRALVVRYELAAKFLANASFFDPLQVASKPQGNGEDIIFSYLAIKESGKLNRIHLLDVEELPAHDAIHKRAGHTEHRTRIMQACIEWARA